MEPGSNRDRISVAERKRYARLQALCWVLFLCSMSVFVFESSRAVKLAFIAFGIACLVGAVVFNFARRFGIRVVWSNRFRG